MAYQSSGHYYRANYYSNPDVIFPTTGCPTGVENESNNAKVITANRYIDWYRSRMKCNCPGLQWLRVQQTNLMVLAMTVQYTLQMTFVVRISTLLLSLILNY